MHDFIEHRPSSILIKLLKQVWQLYSRVELGDLHIRVSESVLDRFAQLKGERTIICPNHPATEDGAVLFGLSSIVADRFAFLTAREMFGKANSFQAWWLQKIGCYSVERGTADIQAFKESCRLLLQGKDKIVIFPEGEISYQNEFLREFENGPELIALSAMHELKQSGSSASIKILPLALKYWYSNDIRTQLFSVMCLIESELGIETGSEALPQRIKRAYELVFSTLEKEQGIEKKPKAGLEDRLYLLSENIISEIEKFAHRQFSSNHNNNHNQMSRIHILINELSKIQTKREKEGGSWLAKSGRSRLVDQYCNQLKRLVRLMVVGKHKLEDDLTQEEAAELLSVLIQEVDGDARIKQPDIVQLQAAEPIDVKLFLPATQGDRKKSVLELKLELERRISLGLSALEQAGKPIMISGPADPEINAPAGSRAPCPILFT